MKYLYQKMKDMEYILAAILLPDKYRSKLCILSLLALADLQEKSSWRRANEEYYRIHDIIVWINKYYPEKGGTDHNQDVSKRNYQENTRESIRKNTILPFTKFVIIEHNGEKIVNSSNNKYRLSKEFAILIRSFGSDTWDEELENFNNTHEQYRKKYSQIKNIEKGLSVNYNGLDVVLTRTPHNKLQKAVLDEFVPRFAPGSELLYIGDTKSKELVAKKDRLLQLGITVLDSFILPDIILYSETEKHKWIIFIEAFTSTGEINIQRKKNILEKCNIKDPEIEIIFLTAFLTIKKCLSRFTEIAWDTEIWCADAATHMIHKNGDKFIGSHEITE